MVALQLSDNNHHNKMGSLMQGKKLDATNLLLQTGATDVAGIVPDFMNPKKNPIMKGISTFLEGATGSQLNSMTAPMSFMQQGMWQELADAVAHSDLAHDMDAESFLETIADTEKS